MRKRGPDDRRLTYEEAAVLVRLPADYYPGGKEPGSDLKKRKREAVARLVKARKLPAEKIGRRYLVWYSDVLKLGRDK